MAIHVFFLIAIAIHAIQSTAAILEAIVRIVLSLIG